MESDAFRQALLDETKRLGIEPSRGQLDALCLHYELLRKWNPRIRLVGTVEPRRAAIELFADSLMACRFAEGLESVEKAEANMPLRIVDIGSGAGFPGIPIKVMRPEWELTVIDSIAKKISFLKTLAAELGLAGIHVVRGRAEQLAHEAGFGERFDLAFCRAVAEPAAACKLAAPFLKIGGSFIIQTTAPGTKEPRRHALERLRKATAPTGVTIIGSTSYTLSRVPEKRLLIEAKKREPNPSQLSDD